MNEYKVFNILDMVEAIGETNFGVSDCTVWKKLCVKCRKKIKWKRVNGSDI
ncbi:hypothetical protein C824_003456 [Schaedlerella arabinosiphila]|jgi:hypothetical protein|nr:hypothetical protein C824_003456 [Schaedlerella arabinosiphila]